MVVPPCPPHPSWRLALAVAAAAAWSLAGCATTRAAMVDVTHERPPAVCRAALDAIGSRAAAPLTWQRVAGSEDQRHHDRWCGATGPPVIVPAAPAAVTGHTAATRGLVIVSWNVHVGSADVIAFVRRLRAGEFTGGEPVTRFVVLLQEAFRTGAMVPAAVPAGLRSARAQGRSLPSARRRDVVQLAQTLGLALFYAPSMRNGAPPGRPEDRGNAILSTEPLSAFMAIELPFAHQRRVAIAATVSGLGEAGQPWSIRVASAHLESTVSARRLWLFASRARARQASGLLQALQPHDALIVGGDFNTWLGYADRTYRTMVAALPDAATTDRRRTFARVFRLDHVFATPPAGWTISATRLDDRLGSDHYPILARLRPERHPGTDDNR